MYGMFSVGCVSLVKLAAGIAVGWVFVLSPVATMAQALRFQPQGAVAAGQGNAFAAQADDASAIHYNPAGLTRAAGIQTVFGIALLGGSIKTKNTFGLDTRGDYGGSVSFPPPGHTYLSANLGALGAARFSDVTIGLGLVTSFGLRTRYPLENPFNSAVTSAELPMIHLTPAIAYRLSHNFSLAVGADIYTFAGFLGEGHVEQKQISAGGLGIPSGSAIELNGTGTGAGVTVGLLYTPVRNRDDKPLISIGAVYRSQAVLPLNGSLLVNGIKVADAETDLVLPQRVTGAVAVWPVRTRTGEWKIELDVEYIGWSSNKNLDVRLSTGASIPQPQRWKNVPVIALGTEYRWLNPGWLPHWEVAARSGYTYTADPVPEETFNPGIISLPAHTLSLGVGVMCQGRGRFLGLIPCSGESVLWPKGIGLDLAYQEWFYESRTVVGNANPTVDGSYHAFVHLGIFSVRCLY
ncbi:MAG: hypothetical protein A4C66_03540 [Nitrospira sp. HN-bin3]|uniref:OmpP1/FadL family transporter n=1 Tax=Nitrospira cf. moscoviensis SBR1015 TaxID=96242 RepID=UPI000A0DFF57|nr:outer membrane protein transport protein [Nitrospira cf. moscoviensis SBR1015]OQW35331.1 MAG: hypothetical protein A4C66_03540 [Nitrospira sp. HN-bin3]